MSIAMIWGASCLVGAGSRTVADRALRPVTEPPVPQSLQAKAVSNLTKNHHRHEPKSLVPRPDLRRIHHSPVFWLGALLFLLAIAIYVLSDDLSWQPSVR